VANRYFGVFQSGEIKCRGIELRRHDTPPFLAELQQEALNLLAQCRDDEHLPQALNRIQALAARCLDDLRHGRIPPEKLVIRQTLSRALDEYKSPSPAAIAARQLEQAGKFLRPGQIVRFIYTLGEPGVRAWDLVEIFNPKTVNIRIYKILLNRMMQTIPRGDSAICGDAAMQHLHNFLPASKISVNFPCPIPIWRDYS
jgi:DNA polymerase-2